jgi:hypothetical protein
MLVLTNIGGASGRDVRSAGLHREHALDVPTHGHQIPFALDIFEASEQTLPIFHDRFRQ